MRRAIDHTNRVGAGAKRVDGPRRLVTDGSAFDSAKQSTLITAIACELAKLRGGSVKHHLPAATQLLEESFRDVEREVLAVELRRRTTKAA